MTMKNILVPVDFSDLSIQIIDKAGDIALAFNTKVFIVHISAPPPAFVGFEMVPQYDVEERTRELQTENRDLLAMENHLKEKGVEVQSMLIQGLTVESIIEQTNKLNADLIVMGTHNHGFFYKTFLGSVSEGVLRKAKCPVMIVPEMI